MMATVVLQTIIEQREELLKIKHLLLLHKLPLQVLLLTL
jgi:hypothetical protein